MRMPQREVSTASKTPSRGGATGKSDQGRTRADLQRERLLRTAAEIFSRRGYRGTSMIDIATLMGLSKPTLYHYYRSKEELLVQLYENVLDESLSSARQIVSDASTPREALHALIANRVAYTCEHRELLTVFFEEEAELPPELAESVLRRRREFEDIVTSVVVQVLKESESGLETPVRVYVNTCLGAANWVYKWYNPKGPLSPQELGRDIATLMIRSLPPVDDRRDGTRRRRSSASKNSTPQA